MKTPRYYYCTRPRLTAALMKQGRTPEIMPNIWDPKYKVWKFELDEKAAQTVIDFYTEEGKPIPKQISRYLEEGAAHD